jgi:lysyl-tRNA synthetase class 2
MSESKSLEALKKEKLNLLDYNPFSINKFSGSPLLSLRNDFLNQSREYLEEKKIEVASRGRLVRIRSFGSIVFADLFDESSSIQLMVTENKLFEKVLDIGDIIGVRGIITKTQKGELSIRLTSFVLLSKCLKNLPDSHYGLRDIEERFRKRYLDFVVNRERKEIFLIRHQTRKEIRKFLDEKGFVEIETPVLVPKASGAQANPFITHHNKLQRDFFLRIATEIPLKKMLVGGFEKVYEIGRVFRNEGIDARHNPEFTTIEIYQAYENAEYMMNLTENLIRSVATNISESCEFFFNFHSISLSKPFLRMSMIESIKEHAKIDFKKDISLESALKMAQENNLDLLPFQKKSKGQIILSFFEHFVEKKLIEPTFIYDYPLDSSPLAKACLKDQEMADRFELYIGGLEFANGYSELNDSLEQEKRFIEQAKQKELGNEEVADFDKDFIEALAYGMPPAGGLGIGIDRLVMLLTEQNSIKEVIAFPQLKSKED